MKNIMLLISSLKNGGAERAITNLANELSKNNNVIMVVGNNKTKDYDAKVKIIEVNELSTARKKIIGIYKVRKLKKIYNIDTTISYTTSFNFINVASKYKDKTIISVRNYLSEKKEGFIPTILHKKSLKKCDLVVNVSESVQYDQLENYHAKKEKMLVIPNFVDLKYVRKLSDMKVDDKISKLLGANTFISVGRLVNHKGHQHIILAMSEVVKVNKNAKLLIFGRGPLEENLKGLIKKLNLEDNVYIMGFDSNPYKYLKNSASLILASNFEGFPNVVIEAMACGTPVISTDCYGGSKEILMNKYSHKEKTDKLIMGDYGILVPNFKNDNNFDLPLTKNEAVLKDAMLKMLDSSTNLHYKERSSERIQKYTNKKIINNWFKVL